MRHIYIILTVLILSSACNAESSPNTPPVVQPTPLPTTIQPTTSHSDETIQAERDAYKEIVKAHQETLNTIKWGIGIIGTLVLALMGYALFKDKKEYDKAVQGAEKACEKAEKWEEKARNLCDEIDTLGKAKLVEIEKMIEQKAQAVLDSIDKKAEAKLKNIGEKTQKSTQEIDAKAKKQMRITALWNDALRLQNEGKYEEACDKYAELIKLNPDDHWAYNNWGTALTELARIKENEELFKDAYGKYAKAVEIKSDYHLAYNNWGGNLLYWARLKIGTPEYEDLLKQAEEKCLKAESLKKGEGAYNLACLYALRNNKEECRKWLLVRQETGTLPERNQAMKDSDFENVKNEQWFRAIKWKGEK